MTFEELEAKVAALEERLRPQRLEAALDRSWKSDGDTPRIIDATGHTLPYEPAIQLMGGTATVDPRTQRVIYTPAASAPTAYEFSADDAVTSTEAAEFRRPADNVLQAAVKTRTAAAGALRELWLVNADTGVSTASGASAGQTGPRAYTKLRTWSGGNEAVLLAGGGATDTNEVQVDLTSDDGLNFSTARMSAVRGEAGGRCVVSMVAVPSAGPGAYLIGTAIDGGAGTWTLSVDNGGGNAWPLMNTDRQSHFLQLSHDGGNLGNERRTLRGPFQLAIPALAAGASYTAATAAVGLALPENTVSPLNARYGVDYVVLGAVKGAAGCETVVWSFTDGPAAAEFTVNVTNLGAGASPACQLIMHTLSVYG